MLQARLLIISSPQSTMHYTSFQLGLTVEREQADFKETLWRHNDPIAYKRQHETAV